MLRLNVKGAAYMHVAVLGAGLFGVGVALELARRGVRVDLFDREAHVLTQAGMQSEGKIHLGYIFANDTSLATADLMARGAATFGPLIRDWLETEADPLSPSDPFLYFVHHTSLVGADVLSDRYATIAARNRDAGGGPCVYYGHDSTAAPTRLTQAQLEQVADTRTIAAAFQTQEIALDPLALAALLRARLAHEPLIAVRSRHEVTAATPLPDGVAVDYVDPDGEGASQTFDHAVNGLWEDRLHIDQTAGVPLPRPWSFRIKHFLRLTPSPTSAPVPTASIVLGPYGDIVRYRDGSVFLSWYPVGRRGMSTAVRAPSWPRLLDADTAAAMRADIHAGLARIAPAVAALSPDEIAASNVLGGIIYAAGVTDVDDPASGLHVRSAVGRWSMGRYHSVDPGKWTSAPLFAAETAAHILGKA
ncbi:MAG: FAD-dependent oxidoreductase [Caulobacterales bacterium]